MTLNRWRLSTCLMYLALIVSSLVSPALEVVFPGADLQSFIKHLFGKTICRWPIYSEKKSQMCFLRVSTL